MSEPELACPYWWGADFTATLALLEPIGNSQLVLTTMSSDSGSHLSPLLWWSPSVRCSFGSSHYRLCGFFSFALAWHLGSKGSHSSIRACACKQARVGGRMQFLASERLLEFSWYQSLWVCGEWAQPRDLYWLRYFLVWFSFGPFREYYLCMAWLRSCHPWRTCASRLPFQVGKSSF